MANVLFTNVRIIDGTGAPAKPNSESEFALPALTTVKKRDDWTRG